MPHTVYVWDPIEDNIIMEKDSDSGETIAHYTTRPTLHGEVLSQDRGGEVRHYHYDGQGNVVSLTDENGNVTDTREYSAFGEVTESTGTTEFPYQWGGKYGYYSDQPTGISELRSHVLSEQLGRWLNLAEESKIGRSTIRTYAYQNNCPTFANHERASDALVVDNPAPADPTDKFADYMKGCKCELSPMKTIIPDIKPEIIAKVSCNNGFKVFFNPNYKPTPREVSCGYLGCTTKHEEEHIRHYQEFCKNVCDNAPCGLNMDPPEQWFYSINWSGPNGKECRRKSECLAYLVSLRCMIEIYDEAVKKNNGCAVEGKRILTAQVDIVRNEIGGCTLTPEVWKRLNIITQR